jgi:arsenate reductase
VFPGAAHSLHWDFDDPAAVEGADDVRLAAFRRIRDEIDGKIREFVAAG